MPVFVEDPSQLSKSRLKSDLIAHSVALPPAESRKEVYVELYLKHIDQKNAADFSSDEEDQIQDVDEKDKEDPESPEMEAGLMMTDEELKATLLKYGFKAGPIVASTRALYEKKLKKLLQPDVQHRANGTGDGAQYSDTEEEEEENGDEEKEESGSEQGQETISQLEQENKQEISQLPQQPVPDVLQEMFPDAVPSPTGIYATRRRPIKGAAGRPVQFKYPDTPLSLSPATLQRQEVERRLVPIYIQILVFLVVVCIIYLIYACVEDDSYNPFVAVLDSLSQGSDGEEGLLPQAETQDTPGLDPLSAQE